MTLKDIRDGILAIIGPDTELQVADLNRFINEGKRFIESKIIDENKDFFPDNETQTITSGATTITPTKTWSNITLVQINFGDSWVTLTKSSLENVLNQATNNLIFCLWGSNIIVPNFGKGFDIRIYGYVVPSSLSQNGDVPSFPEILHDLLVTWGISRALESSSASEDYIASKRKRDEFWEELENLLPQVVMKNSSNVRSLV